MAGLVRKGDLTREVLRQAKADPDTLYTALFEHDEGVGSRRFKAETTFLAETNWEDMDVAPRHKSAEEQ